MATRVVLMCVLFLKVTRCEDHRAQRLGLIDQLSNGMKIAKDFLGSESVALKVADFVVRAFNPKTSNPGPSPTKAPPHHTNAGYQDSSETESFTEEPRPHSHVNEDLNPMAPLRHLVRLFGLQPPQISAVAVNALLFVAQMISTFLSGQPPRPLRPSRSNDPLDFILNKPSSKLQDLLAAAKNESLPTLIEDLVEQQGEEEISCVKLLICKITPFVTNMQKAVFGKEDIAASKESGAAAMYRHLPTKEEINKRGDICEMKHKSCDLNE